MKVIKGVSVLKNEPEKGEDIIKDRGLMTATVLLATSEENEGALTLQLEVVAYLLKKNFDHVSIDKDHDDDITSCIMRRLPKLTSKECLNVCLKVIGTLAGQALLTLHESLSFFERAVEENWMGVIG